jgi:hypothetical protein
MEGRRREVVSGYNEFIQKQKDTIVDGEECKVFTSFFSHKFFIHHPRHSEPRDASFPQRTRTPLIENDQVLDVPVFNLEEEQIPLYDVPELRLEDYVPYGSTALYDSLALVLFRAQAATLRDEAEGKINRNIVVVITDGLENASEHVNRIKLAEITAQTKAEIIYLGSNQDTRAVSQELGIPAESSLDYRDDNILDAIDSLGNAVLRARSGQTSRIEFTEVERGRSSGGYSCDTQVLGFNEA